MNLEIDYLKLKTNSNIFMATHSLSLSLSSRISVPLLEMNLYLMFGREWLVNQLDNKLVLFENIIKYKLLSKCLYEKTGLTMHKNEVFY